MAQCGTAELQCLAESSAICVRVQALASAYGTSVGPYRRRRLGHLLDGLVGESMGVGPRAACSRVRVAPGPLFSLMLSGRTEDLIDIRTSLAYHRCQLHTIDTQLVAWPTVLFCVSPSLLGESMSCLSVLQANTRRAEAISMTCAVRDCMVVSLRLVRESLLLRRTGVPSRSEA